MQFWSSSDWRCNLTNQVKHRLYCYAIYFTIIPSFSPSKIASEVIKDGNHIFGAWLAEVWMCVMDGNENSNHLSRNLLKGISIIERIGRLRNSNYWNSKTFWKNSITYHLNDAIWYYEMTLLKYLLYLRPSYLGKWYGCLSKNPMKGKQPSIFTEHHSGCQVFICLFV